MILKKIIKVFYYLFFDIFTNWNDAGKIYVETGLVSRYNRTSFSGRFRFQIPAVTHVSTIICVFWVAVRCFFNFELKTSLLNKNIYNLYYSFQISLITSKKGALSKLGRPKLNTQKEWVTSENVLFGLKVISKKRSPRETWHLEKNQFEMGHFERTSLRKVSHPSFEVTFHQ